MFKNNLIAILLIAITVSFSPVVGQTPPVYNSTEIYVQLKKLNVLGSVLYVAAHPDDENNSFLPYLAKERNFRTAYLSLTRGDGGQNLIGPEQGIELGLIRTQELLAARRMDGAEQYFSSAYEFGFSKTFDETLRFWNRQKVLSDIVWVIRKFQPDIIINRFPGDARAGHGNHSGSAILSQEAFAAAADPNRFPEQLKQGVSVWKAKRLLWNTFNFGGANTTSENQLKIDAGVYNSMLGKNYGEIGGEARSMHKSQGEGRPRRKGPVFEYFTTLAGDSAKKDLMDGIITDWSRIPKDGVIIQQKIDQLIQNYQFEHPEKSVDALVSLYQYLQGIQYREIWWYKKKQEIEDLIIACSGLFLEATTDVEYAVPGEKLNVSLFINKRNNVNIQLDQILLNTSPDKSYDSTFNLKPLVNNNYSFNKSFTVAASTPVSQPYWLNKSIEGIGNFVIDDQQMVGKAESDPAFSARFVFSINGISFIVNRPVQYKFVDPVRGEVYQPLTVIPPVVISLDKQVLLTNVEQVGNKKLSPASLLLQYKTNFSANNLPVTIQLKDDNEKVFYSKDTILTVEQGSVYAYPIELKSVLGAVKTKSISAAITYALNGKTKSYTHFLKTIKYDHIPSINYFFEDKVAVIDEKVVISPKKVGYIIGAGDLVPEALEQLGYPVTYLRELDITDAELKKYNVIVLGIRAFNIYEWLTTKNEVLNRFVNNGGHLVVQYLKSNQVGLKKVKVGPYPFSMSGIRVTEENAIVNFLLPDHAMFNFPNKITDQDFDGWIQERSTYQADPIAAPYEALISMNDAGEKPSNGSLITAKYGKGNITYVSLVLFRQLPAGNLGAYKLLANIIGLPSSK
ncbi:MAG: PIG-L family deacetylase [Sphingobacteriia bacterium]|nr:MAG: PIG-L family deacetylase [Sphingobacteriia bacterium]